MPSSSSVQSARQALANRLGALRKDAGLTGREVANRCGWHGSKVSRIENARTSPSAEDVAAWCRACEAGEQAEGLIAQLHAVESMYQDWRYIERYGLRAANEAANSRWEKSQNVRSYASWFIPGMLQTPGYTAAVLASLAEPDTTEEEIRGAVEVRMQRQALLRDARCRFAFLIEESLLYASPGGEDVQGAQLDHLLSLGSRPNISLGVIPSRLSRRRRPVEDFRIHDRREVTVELVSGFLRITQLSELVQYWLAFKQMADSAAYGANARSLISAALSSLS